jgi:hypothetical protein
VVRSNALNVVLTSLVSDSEWFWAFHWEKRTFGFYFVL